MSMSDEHTSSETKRSAPLGARRIACVPDLESLAPRLLATVREVADELRPQMLAAV